MRQMLVLAVAALFAAPLSAQPKLELIECKKIWDVAPHNAFTDLVRFKDKWYCVFREGKAHVSPDGALRVLVSSDGNSWESAARVTSATADLRDAKISATPDGRLMLSGAGALHKPDTFTHQSYVWYSKDGKDWGEAIPVADPGYWLWRVTWRGDEAFGFGYGCGKSPKHLNLYRSKDGKEFARHVEKAYDVDYPNESSLLFLPDDTCLCLLRRDGKNNTGQLGASKPPYKDWTWKDLGVRIGGPALTRLPDGMLIATVRLYDKKVRTAVCLLDPKTAKLTEALTLPSGGDTSYAGMVWHDDKLWVSYYSSHEGEGKTSIYLATVKVTK
jgi:hypothetical protein